MELLVNGVMKVMRHLGMNHDGKVESHAETHKIEAKKQRTEP